MRRYFPFTIDGEFDALHGLSDLAVRLYLVLRRYMCHLTGTVGQRRPLSLRTLAELCETAIAKGAGWQRIQPTRKALRVALASLERAGLLERLDDDAPVYRLKKAMIADNADVRPNHTGPEQGQLRMVANPHDYGVSEQTGPRQPGERGTYVNSKPAASFSIAAASSTPQPGDNSAGRIAADFLTQLSKRLGYPILHRHDDPRLAEWVASGLSFETLEVAVTAARAARERDQSRAPLNPAFIAAFLPSPADWRDSWSGIVAKGQALGLSQQPDEPAPSFKARVFAAAATACQAQQPKGITA